jgi:hypothetical protein
VRTGTSDVDVDRLRILLAGLIGVALLAVLLADLAGNSGKAGGGVSGAARESVKLTEYDLLSRAESLDPGAYWVGPRHGTERFEVASNPGGSVLIRYLDAEAIVGGHPALTVARHFAPDASSRLERKAMAGVGTVSRPAGRMILSPSNSHNAYVVFDDEPEWLVRVYSPRQGEAAALTGAVMPLHWLPLD